MSACTPDCWTPVICPECARPVAPRGRDVHMEAAGLYCDWYESCVPGFVSLIDTLSPNFAGFTRSAFSSSWMTWVSRSTTTTRCVRPA